MGQERCQALDMNGRQCHNKSVCQENYHGDKEIYYLNERPVWVRVSFCKKHREESQC